MSSPLGLARCEMALRGVSVEFGDIKESFASVAIQRKQNIQFLTTLAIINAIMQVGNNLVIALGGSAGQQKDGLTKTLDALVSLMFPHLEEETRKRVEAVKKQLEEEYARGPLKVQVMQQPKKASGRVRMGGAKDGRQP